MLSEYGEFEIDFYPVDPLKPGTYAVGVDIYRIKENGKTDYYKG